MARKKSLNISHEQASANILAYCETGRLVQNAWHGRDNDGRAIACLLGAIDPRITAAAQCNGDLMPMWLATLTPILFDGISTNIVTLIGKRYGLLVRQWHKLTPDDWELVLRNIIVHIIDNAIFVVAPLNNARVISACNQCKAAIDARDKDAARVAALAALSAARLISTTLIASDAARSAACAARAIYNAPAISCAAHAFSAAGTADRILCRARSNQLFTFLLDQIEARL
jgi:hypothetical protein